MRVGKQMQFFGARVNLAKALLYAINGGRDELTGKQVAPAAPAVVGDVLDYDDVVAKLDVMLDWLAQTYVDALNCVHFMHDKYAYERLEMALHDREVLRTMACGIAGLSVVADSLSAIKHAGVRPVRNADGLVTEYTVDGDFPTYGNDDDRADDIAVWLVETFMAQDPPHPHVPRLDPHAVRADHHLERGLREVDGLHARRSPRRPAVRTGRQPDERPRLARDARLRAVGGEDPVRRGDGRDLADVVGGPDGPRADTATSRSTNLVGLLDAYMMSSGYHLNINVLNRETLEDAMEHPEDYPQLTIRVSGYAVNFVRLTREQQLDVLSRTFHGSV